MKVTVLVDSSPGPAASGLKSEQGLSLLVESGRRRFLCDTGISSLFTRNAARLGLDPARWEFAVITHGHFDHGGGIATFLDLNPAARVYLASGAFESYHARFFGLYKKYIGLDTSLPEKHPQSFSFVGADRELFPGIHILTDVLAAHPRPAGNRILLRRDGGVMTPDTFGHELILVVREKDGLVVFTGCSHRGLLNMIETVEARFLGETIKALFGGFHMTHPLTHGLTEKRERVARLGDALNCKAHLKKIYTGHCTGSAAYEILKDRLGGKLERITTGSVIEA